MCIYYQPDLKKFSNNSLYSDPISMYDNICGYDWKKTEGVAEVLKYIKILT